MTKSPRITTTHTHTHTTTTGSDTQPTHSSKPPPPPVGGNLVQSCLHPFYRSQGGARRRSAAQQLHYSQRQSRAAAIGSPAAFALHSEPQCIAATKHVQYVPLAFTVPGLFKESRVSVQRLYKLNVPKCLQLPCNRRPGTPSH